MVVSERTLEVQSQAAHTIASLLGASRACLIEFRFCWQANNESGLRLESAMYRNRTFRSSNENCTIRCFLPLPSRVISRLSISQTRCYPVSTRLNQVQNVDAECCVPVGVVQSHARLFLGHRRCPITARLCRVSFRRCV